MHNNHQGETAGAILGAIFTWIGKLVGLISVVDIFSTIVLSFIGAVVGFGTTRLLKRIFPKKNENRKRA